MTTVNQDTTFDEPNLYVMKDSDIYIISVNDQPRYYAIDLDSVHDKIDQLLDKVLNFRIDPDWRYYVNQVSDNEYTITRSYKWNVVSYEETVMTIRYDVLNNEM